MSVSTTITLTTIRRHRTATLALLTGLTFLIDEGTKTVARALLALCRPEAVACQEVRVTSWFTFVRVENAGSALGFGQGMWAWVALAVVGLLLVPVYLRGADTRLIVVAAALQLGGALGNLFDRLVFGGATDFLEIGRVVLNVADVASLAGAGLAVWLLATSPARS